MPRVTMLNAAQLRKLKEEIIKEVGESLKVYRNSEGKPTVGIGHVIVVGDLEYQKPIGHQITKRRSTELYERDIEKVFLDLGKKIPWLKLQSPDVIRIVAHMAFRAGVPTIANQWALLKNILDKDYEAAYTSGLRSLWAKNNPALARRLLGALRKIKPDAKPKDKV